MTYIINVHEWLLAAATITWLFWLVILFSFFITAKAVTESAEEDSFGCAHVLFFTIFVTFIIYRFDGLRAFLAWPNWIYVLGGYLVAGFGIAIYKWFQRVSAFRKFAQTAALEIEEELREQESLQRLAPGARIPNSHSSVDPKDKETPRTLLKKQLDNHYNFHNIGTDTTNPEEPKYYLMSSKSRVALWWTFWPFFLFSVVLDPLTRIIRSASALLSSIFTRISKRFSV